jgi:hypothetical protein
MVQALEEVGQREKAVQEDFSVGKKNEKDDSQNENLHRLLVSCNKIKVVGTRHPK